MWSHPARTHSTLVAPVCRPLPLSVELTCRFARFITKCLNSANSVIKPDAKQSIYFNRIASRQLAGILSSVSLSLAFPSPKLIELTKRQPGLYTSTFDRLGSDYDFIVTLY